jgi:hypothetical protein
MQLLNIGYMITNKHTEFLFFVPCCVDSEGAKFFGAVACASSGTFLVIQ